MLHFLGFRAPIAKDCAGCELAECGSELASRRFRDLCPPLEARFRGQIRRKTAQNTPLGSFGRQF
eukprot:797716-Alexandrium_andersonii.AAC.1